MAGDGPLDALRVVDGLDDARTPRAAALTVVRHLVAGGAPLPSLYLIRGGRLRCQAQLGYGQVLDGIPVDAGVIGRCVQSGRTVVVGDARTEQEFLAAAPDLVAEICTPIRCDGAVVGALNVESTTPLPDHVLGLVEDAAVAYGRRLEQLGGLPDETPAQRVARLASELAGLDGEDAVVRAAVTAAVAVSGMATAGIVVRHDDDPDVRLVAASGPHADALHATDPGDLADLVARVASGTSLFTEGLDDPGLPVPGRLDTIGLAALTVVPLEARGRLLGILLAGSGTPGRIDPDMVASLEVLASQTAASLVVSRTLAQLQDRARRDPLTSLGHGGSFREDLRHALGHLPAGRSLAVLLIDVDGFKQVNDAHGHQEGDRLLQRLAATLVDGLRDDDPLYRIGGDEFATFVVVTDVDEAREVAERLVAAVRRREPTTISVGIALVRAGEHADEGVDEMVRRADDAMYASKAGGRDRVTVAARDVTSPA